MDLRGKRGERGTGDGKREGSKKEKKEEKEWEV